MKVFRALAASFAALALIAAMAGPGASAPFTAIVQKDGVTPVDPSNGLAVNCVSGCVAGTGTASNATSGQASSSTNGQTNAWLYGWNGATWDQILVDGSKNLKINCVVGCSGGTASNASSGVATSSTNGTTNGWLYGFNGTTWDQLQVDGSKNLKINCITGCSASSAANIGATAGATPTSAALIGGDNAGTFRAFIVDSSGRTTVNVNGSVAVTGTFWQATQPVSGTFWQATQPVSQSGTWNIGTITTLPSIPTGGNVIGAVTQSGAWSAAVTSTGATSTQAGATVTTHLTYQSALASSGTRKGCLIVNTSADTLRVFFGATGSATSSNAIPLPAGASISCASGNFVATDNIAITSVNTDGATYVVVNQ